MPDPHWENLKDIFHAAAALPSNERAAYLDKACDGDLSLQAAVESLLKSHDETGNIVDTSAYQAAAEMLAEGVELQPGQTLTHYRIASLLGEGGMGKVYLAQDTKLNRKVAIKFLSADSVASDQANKRLLREAQAAATLDHPNICTVHEVAEENGRSFIVMQYVEGETLEARINGKTLEFSEAISFAIQIADALADAHAHGIIHRDIKSSNVIVTSRGKAKVMDFGLAKFLSQAIESEAETKSLLTTPGTIIGTVPYMSPEQVHGQPLDARTDIFSFGVLLYEMLTGQPPFAAQSTAGIMSAILTKEPAPLSHYISTCPQQLQRIVSKCLEKDREQRYQSARDLAIDLRHLEGDSSANAVVARQTAPHARYTPRQVMFATCALAVLALAGLSVYWWASRGPSINSIAVLPFGNASGDPETEYLSDGITDSLINNLSQLPNLKVMSRNSVFRYKGKEADAQAAGQTLGVRAVLTGKLFQRGDDLSISVELVDARDNSHLWGAQYNRKLSDILSMQAEMAREISERLRLRLSGADEKRLAKRGTENTEAYQLYLKGLFYWNKRTREAYRKAIDFFNQAIEKDPNYASAYAGLAGCYAQGDYPLPPKERMPLARQSALKAIELDDTLAEPHTTLGRVKQEYDWDWEGAEREFKLALELNPNSSLAHMRYDGFLTNLGKHEEAIAEGKKAVALDPISPLMNWSLEFVFYWARRYEEAIEQAQNTLEIDPSFIRSYYTIGNSYERKGMYEQAFEWYLKAANLDGSTAEVMAWKEAYAAAGVKGYYRKQLDLAVAKAEQDLSRQSLCNVAVLYARLGEKEKSLEWLQKAFEERPYGLMFLKIDPVFDNMRSDPRFQELIKRVGLAP